MNLTAATLDINAVVFNAMLLCTSHTHTHTPRLPAQSKSLIDGCRCIPADVVLYTDFVAARLSGCVCNKKRSS